MNELEMIDKLMEMNMSGFNGKTRTALIAVLMGCKARINKDAVEIGSLRSQCSMMENNVNDLTDKEKKYLIEIADKDAIIEGLRKELSSMTIEKKEDIIVTENKEAVVIDAVVTEVEVKEIEAVVVPVDIPADTQVS